MRKINQSLLFGGLFCILMLAVVGYVFINVKPAPLENNRFHIVTTTAHLRDLVQRVAGPFVEVESIMAAGVDPHLYQPSRSDIIRLRQADFVIYHGLHLEGQMAQLLERMGAEQSILNIGNALPQDVLIMNEGSIPDPHIWMDVKIWSKVASLIADAIKERIPERENEIDQRLVHTKALFEDLYTYANTSFQSIPEDQRVLITAHDAFAYLGRAYDIEVVGIQGISTESEAGLKTIENLAERLAADKIKAVFAEQSINDRNIQAIIAGAGSRGWNVTLGGTLFSDTLGPQGTAEANYDGMMIHNIQTITKALGGRTQDFVTTKGQDE